MEKKMERMVHNNVQLAGNRIPKAKRAQTILDMAREQHEKKRRIIVDDDDDDDDDAPIKRPASDAGTANLATMVAGSNSATLPRPLPVPMQPPLTWTMPGQFQAPDAPTARPAVPPTAVGPMPQRSAPPRSLEQASAGSLSQPTVPRQTPPHEPKRQSLPSSAPSVMQQPQRPAPSVIDMTKRQPASPPRVAATAARPSASTSIHAAPQQELAKPEKAKALSAVSSSFKSMCFSTEDPVTSLDATPDGQCIIAAFSNGSVRLFDVNSTCTEERFGYLLGHLDEELNSQMGASVVRVKVTSDGAYCFVGCRGSSPKVVMAIHLEKFRHDKDSEEDNLQKYFESDSKLRGFADASPNASPAGCALRSYYLLMGLGVGTYRIWKFQEQDNGRSPLWTYIRQFNSSSNTALHGYFFSVTDTTIGFAGIGSDKDMKIFRFGTAPVAQDASATTEASQEVVPNTKNISYIKGSFAYGFSDVGSFFRLSLANPTQRDTFDLVMDPNRKGSRLVAFVEHISATDDGLHVIAIADAIVYYCKTNGVAETGNYLMHTIATSIAASLVPKYGIPAAIYVPNNLAVREPVLLLTTNAEEEANGFLTMDPVRKLQRVLARGKPTSGLSCWVCGSYSSLHWGVKSATKGPASTNPRLPSSPARAKPKAERAPKPVLPREIKPPPRYTDDSALADLQDTVAALEKDLRGAQQRVTQVKNEADRRLRAELQLRRSWKKQQLDFESQLATAQTTVDELTLQNTALKMKHKEMKQKAAREAVQHEQEAGVRLQYDQLCNQVKDKISRVDDHQKILEQTTKTLLQVIQRNTQALKHDNAETVLEVAKAECVVCRDKVANTAVYPCGHLCFCQEDGEKYKNHLTHRNQCPVCQVEMISLLRIYAP
ncbi:Aste57867_23864 [Aphanomyces stellatus]|uniref:Aste57867_23864 protein n=1 Tax=Aphanomyces stellatus TaxID=120398 RepID=A0A485LTA8_9STRA|nr:hypothetical protein As57867_023791 [Aphanomyces stellatus]VFU00507.1 Aste57867_23864 [Aphanomyces stellatus]